MVSLKKIDAKIELFYDENSPNDQYIRIEHPEEGLLWLLDNSYRYEWVRFDDETLKSTNLEEGYQEAIEPAHHEVIEQIQKEIEEERL